MTETGMSANEASAVVLLRHENGLHARPSIKFNKLARTFASRVEFGTAPAGPWVDAKSIVRVNAARVRQGSQLHIRATGADADAAVAALVALVERDFDEAGADAGG